MGVPLRDDPFVCFGAKPKKGLIPWSSAWPEVGKGTLVGSWKKEPTGGSWRRARQKGSWESTPDSRSDQSAWDRVQKRWGKASQDESAFPWLEEISRRMHASVSLQGMQCHNLTFLHLSWLKPYCSFVLCSFLPLPWLYFLCHEEKCNAPIGTTRWFTGQDWNGLKKLMYSGGRVGNVTKPWNQTNFNPQKNWPCVTSSPLQSRWLNEYKHNES